MTYGPPPNQPPFPQNPGQPLPPTSGIQGKPSVRQALLAPTGPKNQKSLIVGVVAAVLGVLLIVFSFLTWLNVDVNTSDSIAGVGDMSVDIHMTVTGMGSDSVDFDLDLPAGMPSDFNDQFQKGFDQGRSEGGDPGMPGIWMIVFGVLAVAGGVLIAVRRFPGIGAVLAAVAGFAATIAAIVFVADPLGAFGDGDVADVDSGTSADVSAGYGLWLTLVVSLVCLLAGAAAVALTLFPEKFGKPSGPAAPGFGAPGPMPQQFGGQPQYGQQASEWPQGGYPPATPQQPQYGQPQQPPQYGQQPPQYGQPQQYGQQQPQYGQQPPQNPYGPPPQG